MQYLWVIYHLFEWCEIAATGAFALPRRATPALRDGSTGLRQLQARRPLGIDAQLAGRLGGAPYLRSVAIPGPTRSARGRSQVRACSISWSRPLRNIAMSSWTSLRMNSSHWRQSRQSWVFATGASRIVRVEVRLLT